MFRAKKFNQHTISRFCAALMLVTSIQIMGTESSSAEVVYATGTTPAFCNQDVGVASNITSIRLAGGDCVVEFRNVGSTNWSVPSGVSRVRILVVAGGGGGGAHVGGGGGGGGVIDTSSVSVTGGQNLTIAVGAGGNGAHLFSTSCLNPGASAITGEQITGTNNCNDTSRQTRSANGGNSSVSGSGFTTLTAVGGGGGGSWNYYYPKSGGSGGGQSNTSGPAAGTGTAGQGSSGGNNASNYATGGGGGATAPGGNGNATSNKAGDGGTGYTTSTLTDSSRSFGGGGGNGSGAQSRGGNGGSGIVIIRFTPAPTHGVAADTDTALTLNSPTVTNQYAEVADYPGSPVDITGDVTWEAWVYPTSACPSDQGIISKKESYMLYCGGGVWKYVFDSDGASWVGASSSIAVKPNEWQHVAYVKSGTTLTIYIDGQAMPSITGQPATMIPNDDVFSIGRYGGGNYFQGRIDEVRVYSAARTQAQIQSDMHTYETITDSNLRAYFDFNEGSGSTLFNRDAGAVASDDLTIFNTTLQNWTPIPITSTSQAYTVVQFPRSILTSSGGWKVPSGIPRLSYLVVAGGGAGGGSSSSGFQGGGGGGGGVRTGALTPPNGVITTVVGVGQIYTGCVQARGGNSRFSGTSFSAVEATGGGSGGCYNGSSLVAGNSGGSGGGGASQTSTSSPGNGNAGSYSPVEGFIGGTARADGSFEDRQGGGGGGGATSAGTAATYVSGTFGVTGNGGTGFVTDISGNSLGYGGGGGGGARRNTAGGTATDGGGAGGKQGTQGSPGVHGRGGGGGGSSLTTGNNGGSGVIIIRWITASAPIFTGPVSDTLTAGMVETLPNSADLDLGANDVAMKSRKGWAFASGLLTIT